MALTVSHRPYHKGLTLLTRLVEYNGENRPVKWTRSTDGNAIEMSYDRMGRRVRMSEATFVYDGYLNIGSAIWDPTEPIATRPIALLCDDYLMYYTQDGNKNISDTVSVDGRAIAHYGYTPFGVTIQQNGANISESPWRHSSELSESEIGVIYYNYRHYESLIGRWLSRDPIEYTYSINLGDYHTNYSGAEGNLYLFLENEPCAKIDVRGLFDYLCTCAGQPYPVGEAVSSTINHKVCSQEAVGTTMTTKNVETCITNLGWFECYCAERRCTVTTTFRCVSKKGNSVPVIFVWQVVSSSKSGCHGK